MKSDVIAKQDGSYKPRQRQAPVNIKEELDKKKEEKLKLAKEKQQQQMLQQQSQNQAQQQILQQQQRYIQKVMAAAGTHRNAPTASPSKSSSRPSLPRPPPLQKDTTHTAGFPSLTKLADANFFL